MEQQTNTQQDYKLSYHGKGMDYFVILLVNWLLTIVTLTLYYPWAKVKLLKYVYGSTALNGDRFSFAGTGKEVFVGYLKTVFIFGLLLALYFFLIASEQIVLGIIILYVCIFAIMPVAIHGSYRYRMSRTMWRGVRFGYRGNLKELFVNFYKWILLTIITLGVYGAWFEVKLNNYVLSNIRAGNAKFKFDASGTEYFLLNLKGYLLTLITLGIYSFWWMRDIFAFYVSHLTVEKDETALVFSSKATAGDFFKLYAINVLIIVFTLGLGLAWVETRNNRFMCDMIAIEGNLDLDTLAQTEEEYKDAMGEELAGFFELDLL